MASARGYIVECLSYNEYEGIVDKVHEVVFIRAIKYQKNGSGGVWPIVGDKETTHGIQPK
jgi:hypothetical protein